MGQSDAECKVRIEISTNQVSMPINVGVLGATGCVGQRFIQLLDAHPQFRVAVVGASSRSAGLKYADACQWTLPTPIPNAVASMVVQPCEPAAFLAAQCRLVFSGLDSSVAGDIELAFCNADLPVFSNAKNHRMVADVPLVVPTVNPEHLVEAIPVQRRLRGLTRGFIVTNANCSTTGLAVALKPLHDAFGLEQVHVTTMQAISGAGYPGVPSMNILGNVVPFIDGEEQKIETEPAKILGCFSADTHQFQPDRSFQVAAQCNRVPVMDGHMECVALRFKRPPKTLDDVVNVLRGYAGEAQRMNMYSAPKQAIHVVEQQNRPQPRLDLMNGDGYTVTVGRLRVDSELWHLQFVVLSHNTIIGAAGSAILNAEIAAAKGFIAE